MHSTYLEWYENTSTCSRGRGMPIVRINFCGKGFLQRDHRKASIITWSGSLFSPFAECVWWFWAFSVPDSFAWVAGVALTNFSPAKQSSYLQQNDSLLKEHQEAFSTWFQQDHLHEFVELNKFLKEWSCIINENNNHNIEILLNIILHKHVHVRCDIQQ